MFGSDRSNVHCAKVEKRLKKRNSTAWKDNFYEWRGEEKKGRRGRGVRQNYWQHYAGFHKDYVLCGWGSESYSYQLEAQQQDTASSQAKTRPS